MLEPVPLPTTEGSSLGNNWRTSHKCQRADEESGVTCEIGVVGGFDEVMWERLSHVVTLGQFVLLHH